MSGTRSKPSTLDLGTLQAGLVPRGGIGAFRPSRQAYILATVCLLDLTTTVWLLFHQKAVEANPLMDLFLAQGILAFILAKLTLTALPITVLEWARSRRPVFVRRAANLAIVLYLGMYVAGVVHANTVPEYYRSATEPARVQKWFEWQPDRVAADPATVGTVTAETAAQ